MYRNIKIRFDIYETEYFKSVNKGFKFNFCFATEITLKI